jgi:L-lactate dehydrogenase complex protein LldF
MQALSKVFTSPRRYKAMQKIGRQGQKLMVKRGVIERLPGYLGGWTAVRDVFPIAPQTFREWWAQRERTVRPKQPPREETRP